MEIEAWKDGNLSGNVVGTFDIYFPNFNGMRFKNFRIIRTKKGCNVIGWPSFSIESDGVKKWIPYISFSLEKQNEFIDAIFRLAQPYIESRRSRLPQATMELRR